MTAMRKDYLPYLLALSLLSLLHVAASAGEIQTRHDNASAVSGAAADGASPAALIETTVQRLMDQMDGGAESASSEPEQLYALVNDTVVPHLDMPRIARIVLGKHARKVGAAELDEFTGEFQTLLVRTYATSLMAYQGERIDVSQAAPASAKGTATVDLRVHRADGAPIELSFLTHNRSGPWLVYDIRIEGISLVTNYRSEFSTVLRSQGVEGLITTLKNRNRQALMAANR
jgi:phospholipid transport system substrate-binding protein